MTFQLPTNQEKAEFVHNQFERIAKGYDLTNDLISMGMHRLWKARAVSELIQDKSGSYLDVCSGTGDLALSIAHRLKAEGSVTGLDFSANMLAVAKNRQERLSRPLKSQVKWIEGNALELPFPSQSFDGAIVSFGLRNLSDFDRGVAEMARVVKSGGRVINLDLGESRVPGFAQIFAFYFSNVVPMIGEIVQRDRSAYTYLPQSRTTYPKPDGITEIFKRAQLKNIKHIPLALGTVALHAGTVA